MGAFGSLASLASNGPSISVTVRMVDQLTGGLRGVEGSIARFEQQMIGKFGNIGKAMGLFANGLNFSLKTAAVFGVGLIAVAKDVATFEKEIAGIAAIVGNTTVGSLAAVRQQAISLSKEFAVSATEIAQGQLFIAQAGGSVNDVLTATPAILNLATSTLESFDLAAKSVIKTLNVYGKSISNISDTTRVVNDLQFAVNKSVNTLQTLNDSIKFAAPFTSVLGISLEDLASALIVTANAGIEAGIAGRSLGQGLQQLVRAGMRGASDEAQRFATSLANVINSGGTLSDVVGRLEEHFGFLNGTEQNQLKTLNELSDAEIEAIDNGTSLATVTGRLSELIQVFGVRGARVFGVLLGNSQQMREFRTQMELQVITAADQAKVALDNLASQSKIAFNKIQAGILESGFGQTFSDEIGKLIESGKLDEVGTKLGKTFSELAVTLLPALINGVEALFNLFEAAGPSISALTIAATAGLNLISGILSVLPPQLTAMLIGLLLINNAFKLGLGSILASRLGMQQYSAAGQAASSSVSHLTAMEGALADILLTVNRQLSLMIQQMRLMGPEGARAAEMWLVAFTEVEATMVASDFIGPLSPGQTRAPSARKALTKKYGGKVLGGAIAAGIVGYDAFGTDKAETSGDAAGKALGVGAAAGLSTAFLGPEVAIPVAVGATLISYIADGFKSKVKDKSGEMMYALETALGDSANQALLQGVGQDTGKTIVAGIAIALQGGRADLARNFKELLDNPEFSKIAETAIAAGGRVEFSKDGRSGKLFSQSIGKGGRDATFDEQAGRLKAGTLDTLVDLIPGFGQLYLFATLDRQKKNAQEFASGKVDAKFDPKFLESIGVDDAYVKRAGLKGTLDGQSPEGVTSLVNSALNEEILAIKQVSNEAAAVQNRRRASIEKEATAQTAVYAAQHNLDASKEEDAKKLAQIHDKFFAAEAAARQFNPSTSREIVEAATRAILPKVADGFIQVITNAVLSSGTGTKGGIHVDSKDGNLILTSDFEDQKSSRFQEIRGVSNPNFKREDVRNDPEAFGYNYELTKPESINSADPKIRADAAAQEVKIKQVEALADIADPKERVKAFFEFIKDDSRAFNGTLEELNVSALSLSVTFINTQNALIQSATALLAVEAESANLSKTIRETTGKFLKSNVSDQGTFDKFKVDNGEAIGLSAKERNASEERLAKITALQEVAKLLELQTEGKNRALQEEIGQHSLEVENTKVEIAQAQANASVHLLGLQVAQAEAQAVLLDLMLAQADAELAKNSDSDETNALRRAQLTSAKEALDASRIYVNSYKAAGGEAEYLKKLMEKLTKEQSTLSDKVRQQGDNVKLSNEEFKRLAASVGINADDMGELANVTEATLKEWVQALVAAKKQALMQERINKELSGAEPLGKALESSVQGFTQMGYSAAAIDDALKSFRRIQFLNSVIGFLNNFKDLASSTGRNLGLGPTILAVQNQILDAGSQFLDQLLNIANPQAFSEILAKQSFINQTVNRNTVINLQADLIFPDGISADQREEISKVALNAVNKAINDSPLVV